ncbi:MAG: xylose isomerase [Bacteroidetes bacterium GWF2_42_66]|nr:MAG: xylose isomerase [Bacteroidetes bacterium GWA2_42_15]OFY01723.1 MAG: xylose isomerase [Bacteroidetes bacterium GWE2_42_39]OFY46470.1 MAG: xylose isomerase [Bacteroidetes bacterium GWF2_42_66]HBL76124.1 xylose isomerase [Prolixibacteraceae bacterium]HCU62240.1 xylose isomerase [Prolixibacteraceae bacterium]
MENNRREFLKIAGLAGIGVAMINPLLAGAKPRKSKMKFGMVTFQWAKDWDLSTLIANCKALGIGGVELRTQHAHKVEANLSAIQRLEVKKQFEDSGIICLGYGSNFEYHSPDTSKLRTNIEKTKEYIKLCSDIGATGLKVKPNTLPAEVAKEKTIAQIAASLNEVGKFAQDFDQLIRVEIHGPITAELPNMKAIFDQVTEPNVKMCWNCNDTDLLPPGLEENFNMVKKWLGDTIHIHELDQSNYPYPQLFSLLNEVKYNGWLLLESLSNPDDKLSALKEQRSLFSQLIENDQI